VFHIRALKKYLNSSNKTNKLTRVTYFTLITGFHRAFLKSIILLAE